MNRNAKKMRTVIIPCVVVLVLTVSAIVFMNGKSVSTGRCIVSDNGSVLWLSDSAGPTVLNDRSIFGGAFDKLKTGDKIWIIHADAVAESYPGQVSVYACLRIGGGSIDDIPQDAVDKLREGMA